MSADETDLAGKRSERDPVFVRGSEQVQQLVGDRRGVDPARAFEGLGEAGFPGEADGQAHAGETSESAAGMAIDRPAWRRWRSQILRRRTDQRIDPSRSTTSSKPSEAAARLAIARYLTPRRSPPSDRRHPPRPRTRARPARSPRPRPGSRPRPARRGPEPPWRRRLALDPEPGTLDRSVPAGDLGVGPGPPVRADEDRDQIVIRPSRSVGRSPGIRGLGRRGISARSAGISPPTRVGEFETRTLQVIDRRDPDDPVGRAWIRAGRTAPRLDPRQRSRTSTSSATRPERARATSPDVGARGRVGKRSRAPGRPPGPRPARPREPSPTRFGSTSPRPPTRCGPAGRDRDSTGPGSEGGRFGGRRGPAGDRGRGLDPAEDHPPGAGLEDAGDGQADGLARCCWPCSVTTIVPSSR